MSELYELTASVASQMLANGEISSTELVKSVQNRIDNVDKDVKSYVMLMRESAIEQAKLIDEKRNKGEKLSSLAGIPLALKDILCTKGVRTTCCSKILENFIPPYNATAVTKMQEAGIIFMGKTNMDEFAMGSSTENSAFGPSKNPWDLNRVPGGSSGGTASAIAADEGLIGIGTDTGGSIRQPAAYCGVVGLKPTYGRVSRFGLIAFASSLDQIGPITKDVRDAAMLLNVLAGPDKMDSTCLPEAAPDYTANLGKDIRGMKIGIPKEFVNNDELAIDHGVADAINKAIDTLSSLGAEISECTLPNVKYSLPVYYIIAPAEASSNLARYDGVEFGFREMFARDTVSMMTESRDKAFGQEVKRRIMLGTYALSSGYYDAYYTKASMVRTLIRKDFEDAFSKFDLLLTPTTPSVAFKIGDKVEDPMQMYMNDICTIPINMAGIPAISIPCGYDNGLPVGMQLIGAHWQEEKILQAAFAYEQAAGWKRKAHIGINSVTAAG
ncbi:MAG: Asp-tRNA(Asn)/Glu-tRNA(Gln) amidotransferase subunit GatA [bacterium]